MAFFKLCCLSCVFQVAFSRFVIQVILFTFVINVTSFTLRHLCCVADGDQSHVTLRVGVVTLKLTVGTALMSFTVAALMAP